MDKKELIKKIAELLNIRANKADYAFYGFLKNLSSSLRDGEALKIPGLGVFQLKKEPPLRGESGSSTAKDIIIFIPLAKPSETRESSLYLTFDVPETKYSGLDFDENVFSPSVEKPVIPIGEDLKKETHIDDVSSLESKIDELIKNSEKLDNFEIWKEYPKAVEEEREILGKTLSGDDIKKSGFLEEFEDEIPEEVEEKPEEDVNWNWSEDIEKELIDSSDEDMVSTTEGEESKPEIDTEKLEKKLEELRGDVTETSEEKSGISPSDGDSSEISEPVPDKEIEDEEDPFKALENTIIDYSEETIKEEDINKIVDGKDAGDIPESTKAGEPVEKTDITRHDEKESEEVKGFFEKYKYYILSAGLIVVLYWLFAPGSGEPVKEFVRDDSVAQTEVQDDGNVIASFDSETETKVSTDAGKNGMEKNKQENELRIKDEKRTDDKTAKDVGVKKNIPSAASSKPAGDLYREIANERNVGGNIFYDGKEYMVQVSSWRNSFVAKKEAQKLRRKGYDAFVVKAYVKKFNATFHRVRIGGFKTKREALNFAKKNL